MTDEEKDRQVGRTARAYVELRQREECLRHSAKRFGEALAVLAEKGTESSDLHPERDPREGAKDLIATRAELAEHRQFLSRLGILGVMLLGLVRCGGGESVSPTVLSAPVEPSPPPAPEPEPEPEVVREPVQWPVPCDEWPESPCPSPLTPWAVPSHVPDVPLCESRWAFNVDRGSAPTLYSPQVFLSAEASQAEKAIHGSFVTVMLWFDLPFPDRPEYGGQRAEGDWVGVRATYYDRVYDENRDSIPWGRVTGNVIDLDLGWLPSQGWPDAWGRPDLDWMTPPHVPFAVELRREVSGADSRLDMPLLCAGAVPGGSP